MGLELKLQLQSKRRQKHDPSVLQKQDNLFTAEAFFALAPRHMMGL
jgi:hypothetical protein